LCDQVTNLRNKLAANYSELRNPKPETAVKKVSEAFEKDHAELAKTYNRFYFKQKVTEDLVTFTAEFSARSAALKSQAADADERKDKSEATRAKTAFEKEVWMTQEEFDTLAGSLKAFVDEARRAKDEMVE